MPVKLYSAVADERVSFHMLHDQDGQRLRQEMYCPVEDKPVPREHVIRGYEVDEGRYVLVTEEDIEKAEPESSRDVAVDAVVPLDDIDGRWFDRAYYLGPDDDAAAYAALAAALGRAGRAAVCRWTMRKRPYLGALRSKDGVLSVVTLNYSDEVIGADALELPGKFDFSDKEMKTARYLIDALSGDFDITAFTNDYQDRVRDLVNRKAKGKKIKPARPKRRKVTKERDLLATLEASVEAARSGKGDKFESKTKPKARSTPKSRRGRPRASARERRTDAGREHLDWNALLRARRRPSAHRAGARR